MIETKILNLLDQVEEVRLPEVPNECPNCFNKITPIIRYGYLSDDGHPIYYNLCIAMQCPAAKCKTIFLASYSAYYDNHNELDISYVGTNGLKPKNKDFAACIQEISPSFCSIYNQALAAELYGLTQICGAGYRKSLEFLIKDYLIAKRPDVASEVRSKALGSVINEYISSDNIKTVARCAAYLGNDETHYQRTWKDEDLTGLKKLIDVTLHWIEAEEITLHYATKMLASSTQ